MRTPTEIFEAVLDAWDDDMKALWSPFHLDEHRAKAAVYREEFRQALSPPLIGTGSGTVVVSYGEPVPLSPPEQALADANPSTYGDFAGSFDAQKWASAFVKHAQANPAIPTDEGTMTAWFANALMRGWDEHASRMPEPTASAEEAFGGRGFSHSGPFGELVEDQPSRLPAPIDALKEKLREAGALRSRAEGLLQESRHRLEEVVTVGDRAIDDDEFRRRRDESAERYTKDDGSRK